MCNAVRENLSRAEFIGYSSYMIRYLSFCFAGFLAGIAGTLFVINYELVSPEVFSLREAFNILWATFIGGTGYFLGPIIGASVFSLSGTALTRSTELWPLYQGILLMLFVLYLPRGLAGFFIDQKDIIKSRHKLGAVYHSFKIIIPSIITLLSISWLVEYFNIILHHQERSEFVFLWTLFSISNRLNCFLAIFLAVFGIYFLVVNLNKEKNHSV